MDAVKGQSEDPARLSVAQDAQNNVEAKILADLPGKAYGQGWRRLHPLSPVLRSGLVFFALIVWVIVQLRDRAFELLIQGFVPSEQRETADIYVNNGDLIGLISSIDNGAFIVIGCLLGICLLLTLVSLAAWLVTRYRLTAENIEYRAGLIFKQQKLAPLKQIQGVDIERKLLTRILGLAAVKITTAAAKIELQYLSIKDAKIVRAQLLRAVNHAKNLNVKSGEAAAEPLLADTQTNPQDASAAAATLAVPAAEQAERGWLNKRVDDILDYDEAASAYNPDSLLRVQPKLLLLSYTLAALSIMIPALLIGAVTVVVLSAQIDISELVLAAGVPLVVALVGVPLSLFNKFSADFNHAVSVAAGQLRITGGLTTTKTETVPLARINSITVSMPLLWRPFNWYRVKFSSSGGDVANTGTTYTAMPVCSRDDVVRVLRLLLPNITDQAITSALNAKQPLQFHPVKRAAPWLLLSTKISGVQLLELEPKADQADFMLVRSGFVGRRAVFVNLVRAQGVEIKQNAAHRLLNLLSVQVVTVGSSGSTKLKGLERSAAQRLFCDVSCALLGKKQPQSSGSAGAE